MICYKDRTYCNKEACRNYLSCQDSFYCAAKEQTNKEPNKRKHLPYAVRDMSEVCKRFRPHTLGGQNESI